VAAAFDSPIGGVLFSLEEGSSFWSTKLTWRCFFCAMATLYTIYACNTASSFFSSSMNYAMFSFGKFYSLQGERSNYSVWELTLFIVLGASGGCIGAVFNFANSLLTQYRHKHLRNRPVAELLECILVCSLYTIIAFGIPFLWTKCTPLPVSEQSNDQETLLASKLVPLYCTQGTHYNELASLYLVDSDTAIKQLFHFKEIGDTNDKTFSSTVLLLFFVPYILVACLTCGLAIPAGMFVPSLLSGAAFGRYIGHCLHNLDNTRGTFADAGTYALMGSAAITGGITRMTISLTVMILEGTGDMQYVLPLMLTVMSAKLVGDFLIVGLYDVHIHSRRLHFLSEDESVSHIDRLHDLAVREVMTAGVITTEEIITVGDALDILQNCSHQYFPVVESKVGSNILCGIIARKVMCALIKHKAYSPRIPDCALSSSNPSHLISWETLESAYPRYPTVDELVVSEDCMGMYLDLRPYIDVSAYTINDAATVQRTYRMFRTLGLRHLCVVNKRNELQGIVTRANLTETHVASTRSLKSFELTHSRFKRNGGRISELPLVSIRA
jgi:chloride channel 7